MSAFRLASFVLAVSLAGCAVLPNSVRPEIEHMSHLTQHEPFTSHPTHDSASIAWLLAHWDVTHHGYVEVGEGFILNHSSPGAGIGYGEIGGPREQFTARFGLIIPVKP
jgi:hypothetical protein